MATLLDKPARWLAEVTWEDVVALNVALCARRNALHEPASGFSATEAAWRKTSPQALTFGSLAEFLLHCHRLAPFCFYNGNTFSAIARDLLADVPMTIEQATKVRSIAGHAIAGVLPLSDLNPVLAGITLPDSWEWPLE